MTLKQLKKRLNPAAKRFGLYTAYALDSSEYIGYIDSTPHLVAVDLYEDGYEKPPTFAGVELAAAKIHSTEEIVDEYSCRKVDPDNPRWQWHVHLFKIDDVTEIFSHYEMRPDFKKIDGEDTAEMLGRLQIHYRPEYGTDYYQGKADPVVQDLVND